MLRHALLASCLAACTGGHVPVAPINVAQASVEHSHLEALPAKDAGELDATARLSPPFHASESVRQLEAN